MTLQNIVYNMFAMTIQNGGSNRAWVSKLSNGYQSFSYQVCPSNQKNICTFLFKGFRALK